MKPFNNFYLPLTAFILFFLFSSSLAHNQSHEASNLHGNYRGCFSKVFAFGGSYTDGGNADLMRGTSSPSHGSTVSQSKNNHKQTCDGRLLVDFLCDALGIPTLPPFKDASVNFSFGVNFAIGGSTALPIDFLANLKVGNSFWKLSPLSFQTQIDWFIKFLAELGSKDMDRRKAELDNALFWIGQIGVDDYARALSAKASVSLQWITEKSIAQVSKLLETLLENGAKYIVVQGLPPLGCLPIDISLCPLHKLDYMGCAAASNRAAMIHNQILQRKLEKLRKLFPHCIIVYADFWKAFLDILANRTRYQFEKPFKACCGSGGELNFNMHLPCGSPGTSKCQDPSKYISWDGIHLTEAMHRHLADLFLNQGYCQPSFAELVKIKERKG